jgi:hypothetical protein
MNRYEKHMFIALGLATTLMLFNIFAVTTGMADGYYAQLSDWLRNLLA